MPVKTFAASSEALGLTGRMDAPFHLLMAEHAPVVAEVVATMTLQEMIDFAKMLPYDDRAANAVAGANTTLKHRDQFFAWLDKQKKVYDVAVYIGAAVQFGAAKILTEMLEYKKAELALLTKHLALQDLAKTKGLAATLAALKRGK